MVDDRTRKYMFFYQVLSRYREITFGKIISVNDLIEEVSIKVGDEHKFFWSFIKNKEKYLVSASPKDFPIIIKDTSKYSYRGKAHNIVSKYAVLDIKPEKVRTFREIIDDMTLFTHSNPDHQKLSAIIALAAYIDRINVRICSEKEFGKDSIFECIAHLKGDVCIFNPESLPAIEYRLNNKVLVLNEIGTMPKEQRTVVLKALLLMGGGNNTYDKAKRSTALNNSQDVYDISDLSVCLIYNPSYYYNDEDMFFDNAFKSPALKSRFIPFFFTGSLDIKQFKENINVCLEAGVWKDELIKITKSILYYKEHKYEELKDFGGRFVEVKNKYVNQVFGRHQLHLDRILNALNLYCDSLEEFERYATILLKAHTDYDVKNNSRFRGGFNGRTN